MRVMPLYVFAIGAALLAASFSVVTGNGNATTNSAVDAMGDGPIGVYYMTNFFLDNVIQKSVLTSMPKEYTSSTTDLFKSFVDHWNDWVIHYIGFVVCAAIGIVGFVIMVFALFIFPCCRCCGNCGATDPEYRKKKRKSKCCIRACEVSLIVVIVSVILANIAMYSVNEKLYPHLKTGLFDDVYSAIDGVDQFIKQVPADIETSVLGGYVRMEDDVFQLLDAVPPKAIEAINDATGAVTALTTLSSFTSNLPILNQTLYDAIQLATQLDVETNQLWANFTPIRDRIIAELNPCSTTPCQVEFANL